MVSGEMVRGTLAGRVAIVTGGGRGIGREIALAYARAGAGVAVTARSANQIDETVRLIAESGGPGLAIVADVTDRQAVEDAVSEVDRTLGPIDILVNNAGSFGDRMDFVRPSWEFDPDDWWHDFEVNVRGAWLFCRAVLPGMVTRREGRIINLVSTTALRGGPQASSYGPSKTALLRLTESLANETREHGIIAVAMEPGIVETRMTERATEAGAPWFRSRFAAGRGTPIAWSGTLALDLATLEIAPLSGLLFASGDDVEAKIRQGAEIVKQELYQLRMQGLPEQPIEPWRSYRDSLR